MQTRGPEDITGSAEGLASQTNISVVPQHEIPLWEADRDFNVFTSTRAPSNQPLPMELAATTLGELAAYTAITTNKATSSETTSTTAILMGSSSKPGQMQYKHLGAYNPLAALSPTNSITNIKPEVPTTQPPFDLIRNNYSATTARKLVYNPLQLDINFDADASNKPSADSEQAQPTEELRTPPAGTSAVYNPLRHQTIAPSLTSKPMNMLFNYSCLNASTSSTSQDSQRHESSFPCPVPVPVPVAAESSGKLQASSVQTQPLAMPVPQKPLIPRPPFRSFPAGAAANIPIGPPCPAAAGMLSAAPLALPTPLLDADAGMEVLQTLELLAGAGPPVAEADDEAKMWHEHPAHHQQQDGKEAEQFQSQMTEPDVLQSQIQFLHEMVGGRADEATCRDVLQQVGGDMERASHIMLDMYSIGGGDCGCDVAACFNIGDAIEEVHPAGPSGSGGPYKVGGEGTQPNYVNFDGSKNLKMVECHGEGYLPGMNSSIAGQPLSLYNQPDQWEWWDEEMAEGAAGDTSTWNASTAAHQAPAAVAIRDDAGTWEDCGDVGSGLGACGVTGGGPDAERGSVPEHCHEVEAQGIFSVGPLGEAVNCAAGTTVPGQAGDVSGPAPGLTRDDNVDADDTWDILAMPPEDEAAEKMEELRIYFPNLDEDTLRTHLMFFHGDVQQALQLLSELHEDDIYHRIEMERQAESDAALARKLAEQHAIGSPGAADSAAEDYVLNILEELETQVRHMELFSSGAGVSRSAGAGLRQAGMHWGLKLLVHIFGEDVEKELLTEVLANQGGNVDAARAALCSMGLTEQQQQQQQQPGVGGGCSNNNDQIANDSWFGRDEPADAKVTAAAQAESSAEGLDSSLGSHRGPPPERGGIATGTVGGSLASRMPFNSSFNSSGAGSRHSGSFHLLNQQYPAATAVVPSRAGGGTHHEQEQQQQQQMGPIRLLAALGVDFQKLEFSEEALQCIRVAFHNSPLPLLLQRSEAGSTKEVLERQQLRSGRPDHGLTHEEKQALWAQHRELPLALKAMQEVLRRGAQAAFESGTSNSKRLSRELRMAANALGGVIKEQHRKASAHIYADMNAALRQQWKTDLHAQLPAEVPMHLDRVFKNLSGMGGHVDWLIIMGKGLHSRGDRPKLPAIVDEWLASRTLEGLPQPGAVLVRLTPEVFARVEGEPRMGMGTG